MTVWIVNPFDNLPAEGCRPQRYWLMARAFARAGHQVIYWSSDFSHAKKCRRALPAAFDADGVAVRLVPTLPYSANVCLRRVWSHRRLAHDWARLAAASPERPALVIASTPPLGLCAAALDFAHRSGARFVADIMDAWPETFERVAPRPLLAPLRATARRIYRSADAISAVASRYLELARSYGATAPTRLAYHGIALRPDSRAPSCVPASPRAVGTPLRLAYLGAMSTSYDLETVLDAVIALPGTTLDLAGSGPKEAALRARAAGCPRINFHGFLGDSDVRALLEDADVGLVPMFPDSCVGVPYKLADYAAARLRVAECLGGETESLVARHHAGLHYEASSVESLTAALRHLMAPPDPAWDPDGFVAEFDADRIFGEYVKWLDAASA